MNSSMIEMSPTNIPNDNDGNVLDPTKIVFYVNNVRQYMVRKAYVSTDQNKEAFGWLERVWYISDESGKPEIGDDGLPVTIPSNFQERIENDNDNLLTEIVGGEKYMYKPRIMRRTGQVKWVYDV